MSRESEDDYRELVQKYDAALLEIDKLVARVEALDAELESFRIRLTELDRATRMNRVY
jgi:hypothetical protein